MVEVFPASEAPAVIRKSLEHSPDVFMQARDFYGYHKDMRQHKIVAYKDGEVAYCLGFSINDFANKFKNRTAYTRLPNYWHYDLDDDNLDMRYAERFELIIFDKIEEYSWLCTNLIAKHAPTVRIAFTDDMASLFFADNDRVLIAKTEDDLFAAHPELSDLRTLRCTANIYWDIRSFFMGKAPSILLLTGIYWLKREFTYGYSNPDKTFYLIKQPVKENGITAVVSNVIGTSRYLKQIRPDYIPVVDLAMPDDRNQFAGASGEDVWSMFFKPISPYSLEEVYDSEHVILDQTANVNANPYLTEFTFTNARAEVKYSGMLQYRDDVKEFVDKTLDAIWPTDGGRVLAVVARGTDYTAPSLAPFLPKGITVDELIGKVRNLVAEKGFEHIYLATEDVNIYERFMSSDLGDKIFCVDQQRVDYTLEENYDKLLLDIYARDEVDPYQRTLIYLADLEGIVRCNALVANVTCGAVTYSLGWEPDYEFVDVPKIMPNM